MQRRRPRGAKIPHALELYGEYWTVEWAKEDGDGYSLGKRPGQHLAEADLEYRVFRIWAGLRYDLQMAWESLIHEVLHVINARESAWRRAHEAAIRKDISALTEWKMLEHEDLFRLDLALGRFLADNRAVLACACKDCRRRRRKEILKGETG